MPVARDRRFAVAHEEMLIVSSRNAFRSFIESQPSDEIIVPYSFAEGKGSDSGG
jgi:hypothetical protein